MDVQEAARLKRTIEDLLGGSEIALLKVEESSTIPGWWGVTIKLTTASDWRILRRALCRQLKKGA